MNALHRPENAILLKQIETKEKTWLNCCFYIFGRSEFCGTSICYSFQKICHSPSDRPVLLYDEIIEQFFVWFSKPPRIASGRGLRVMELGAWEW